jgi:2-iminobutanoate/2-iminopropanoate deaminase
MVEHQRDGVSGRRSAGTAGGSFRRAVRTGSLLFVAGQVAADRPGVVLGDASTETRVVMELLGEVLSEYGVGYDAIVRCGVYLTDLAEFAVIDRCYRSYFTAESLPARTCVQVAALLAGCRVEIDAVARIPRRRGPSQRRSPLA